MKKCTFFVIVIILVLVIAISFLLFYPHGKAEFHESFLMEFDPYKMCKPSVLSSALTNESYSVQQYTTPNEGSIYWELRIPELAKTHKIITNIHILTYDEMPEKESISYSITWERPQWTRKKTIKDFNEDSWRSIAYQAEFMCNVVIATQNVGYYELYVYGDSIDACIREAEDLLLKIYYDLANKQSTEGG